MRRIVTTILLVTSFPAFAAKEMALLPRQATVCTTILTRPELDQLGKNTPPEAVLIKMRNWHMTFHQLPKVDAINRVLGSVVPNAPGSLGFWRDFDRREDIENFLEIIDDAAVALEDTIRTLAPEVFWSSQRISDVTLLTGATTLFAGGARLLPEIPSYLGQSMTVAAAVGLGVLTNKLIQTKPRNYLDLVRATWNREARARIQNADPHRIQIFKERIEEIQFALATRETVAIDDVGLAFTASTKLLRLLMKPAREDDPPAAVNRYEELLNEELARVLRGEFMTLDRHIIVIDFKYFYDQASGTPHLLLRTRIQNPYEGMGHIVRPDRQTSSFWGQGLIEGASLVNFLNESP